MKKFTNVRMTKMKFRGSDANESVPPPPPSGNSSAAASAGNNIRADYYASRGGASGGGSSGGSGSARNNVNATNNPFDDDDDDNDCIPRRPQGDNNAANNNNLNSKNPSQQHYNNNPFDSPQNHRILTNNNNMHNPNPFDDDDSDDDHDDEVQDGSKKGGGERDAIDPLALFARKNISTTATKIARNANPFDDVEKVENVDIERRITQNPFDNDDHDDDDNSTGRGRKNGMMMSQSMPPSSHYRQRPQVGGGAMAPSSAGIGGTTSTNPFAEDDTADGVTPRGKLTTKSSNPFGDNDDDSEGGGNGVNTRSGGGGQQRRQSTRGGVLSSSSTRPSPPPPPPPRQRHTMNSNPFDDDSAIAATTEKEHTMKTTTMNEGLPPPLPPRALLSQVLQQQQQRLPTAAHERSTPPISSGTNPFGNDTPRSSAAATTTAPVSTPRTTASSFSASSGIRNTPFGKETPRPSTATPTATLSSNTTITQPIRPASATTPGLLPPSSTAKTRWATAITSIAGGIGAGGGDPSSLTRPLISAMDEESVAAAAAGGTSSNNNTAGLASWLRMNKKDDEGLDGGVVGNNQKTSTVPTNNGKSSSLSYSQQKSKKLKAKKKCRAYVTTPWPFDNYHEVQEQLYEELASRAASEYSAMDRGMARVGIGGGYNDDKRADRSSNKAQGGGDVHGGSNVKRKVGGHGGMYKTSNSTEPSKYYERPEELPSIKEAVNDLPLVDFEKKAQERAINIVSTWLFDAGLIDELLVNGATGPQQQQQRQQQPLHYAMKMRHSSSSGASIISEKTSEGQELGAHGFLVGMEVAEHKIDKETNKLRAMIQRDLSIINARLNDGVAASGLEVQELVNSVAAAKEDIGRLRELTTYISDGQTFASNRDEFLLAKYPYLRKAINARRNINRFFRELEFFSHIPSTCERLRDDLHGGEWTDEEWSTIRNVSMEHVELEVMLVEAEDSMKGGAHNFNDATVDNFLEAHVQNVWELGDEIRMRIISGVGSAFELSMNNPAGMVALVEAVEVYERAAETFEKKRSVDNANGNRLRFTNMRAAALEQLYQDFELRGVDMFRGIHEHAADLAEEDDADNTQFTAVLKAATELVTEIDIVKHQMSPCFAPHWHVEALWSSCVAHVCSNHIIQQIGGPEGQHLPDLTITQLLELVAWVEYFRETIEETFPEVASMRNTKKTYFEERPELFDGDKRTVNMQNAWESLAWANNMLWEVHRLAQEEFLVRTRGQTDEWLDKVYGSEAVKNQSAEGKLTTSLCEDVFSFSSVQLRTIRERLSKKSDALILAVCIIISHMRSKQVHSRNIFLQDLETCCAASNDFTRMSEKCEDMVSELMSQCQFSEDMIATLEASSNELMGVYSSDAVYSARSVHIYVFDPIEEEIGVRLFEEEWEETMVDNDLAISLVRTLEDFHEDLEHYMDDFMVVKSMMSLMSASVIFYAKCLLQRAEKHRSNKRPYFNDVKRALDRMTGDIKVMREYFESLVVKMPSLKKNIEKDFEILATIHELMSVAAGFSESGAEDFILVLQKRVRDVGITKHIIGDLWHLVAPMEERYVWELVESMEEQLTAIAPFDDALALEVNDRSYVKGLRLDEMAVKLYVKSRRNRPIKATAVESIVKNWGKTWSASAEYVVSEENEV